MCWLSQPGMLSLLLSAPLLAQGVALGDRPVALQDVAVQQALPQQPMLQSGVGVQSVLHFSVQQQEVAALLRASELTGSAQMPSSLNAYNEGGPDDGDRHREEQADVVRMMQAKVRHGVTLETEAKKRDLSLEERFESLKKHITKNGTKHLRKAKPAQVERLAFSVYRSQGLDKHLDKLDGLDKHVYCGLVTATHLDPAGVADAVCALCQTTSSVPAFCPGSTAKTGWQRARMVCAEANIAAAPASECEFNEQNAKKCSKAFYGAASTQLLATGQPSACVRQSASTCSKKPPLGTADCCKLNKAGPSASNLRRFANTFRVANALHITGNALQRSRNACHKWLKLDQTEGLQACQAVYAFPSALRVLHLMNNVAALATSTPVPNAVFDNETVVSFDAVPDCETPEHAGDSGHGQGHSNGTACELYAAYAKAGGSLTELDEACDPVRTQAKQQRAPESEGWFDSDPPSPSPPSPPWNPWPPLPPNPSSPPSQHAAEAAAQEQAAQEQAERNWMVQWQAAERAEGMPKLSLQRASSQQQVRIPTSCPCAHSISLSPLPSPLPPTPTHPHPHSHPHPCPRPSPPQTERCLRSADHDFDHWFADQLDGSGNAGRKSTKADCDHACNNADSEHSSWCIGFEFRDTEKGTCELYEDCSKKAATPAATETAQEHSTPFAAEAAQAAPAQEKPAQEKPAQQASSGLSRCLRVSDHEFDGSFSAENRKATEADCSKLCSDKSSDKSTWCVGFEFRDTEKGTCELYDECTPEVAKERKEAAAKEVAAKAAPAKKLQVAPTAARCLRVSDHDFDRWFVEHYDKTGHKPGRKATSEDCSHVCSDASSEHHSWCVGFEFKDTEKGTCELYEGCTQQQAQQSHQQQG